MAALAGLSMMSLSSRSLRCPSLHLPRISEDPETPPFTPFVFFAAFFMKEQSSANVAWALLSALEPLPALSPPLLSLFSPLRSLLSLPPLPLRLLTAGSRTLLSTSARPVAPTLALGPPRLAIPLASLPPPLRLPPHAQGALEVS